MPERLLFNHERPMTVICAYTDGAATWIGSDTYGIATGGIPMEVGKKWYGAHGWAFGHCGDAYVADLFEEEAETLFAELRRPLEFVWRAREMFERAGLKASYREGETVGNWQNSGILVRAGSIWDIDDNLAVTSIPGGRLHARGSAGCEAKSAAYGYARAMRKAKPRTRILPLELINVAIDCAIEFDVNIRGKWMDWLGPGDGEISVRWPRIGAV